MTYEYQLSKYLTLVGDIESTNDSYDHQHGTRKVTDYDVTNFAVLILTEPFTQWEEIVLKDEHTIDRLKTLFLNWYLDHKRAG